MRDKFYGRLLILPPAIAFLMMFTWSVTETRGQQLPEEGSVRIADVEINTVTTPNYEPRSHSRARVRARDWLQIMVSLRTEGPTDEWLDSLSVNWHVMIEGGQTPFLYFQTSTEYVDVRMGEDHNAAVYIRPDTIERHYGDRRMPRSRNMVVHVVVAVDNVPVANTTYNPGRMRVPDEWWRSSRMNRVENGLLAPDKTPFQWLDYDFYMTLNPGD